jgi:threonine dehydrogenase-like Zn-dependent dehydrogenase
MRAAIFDAPGLPLRIADVPDPQPGPRDVLIRVEASGICISDVHFTDPRLPGPARFRPGTVLGHEFCGEIIAVGSDAQRLRPGDRVAAQAAHGCGSCLDCRLGKAWWCAERAIRCGGYAQVARVRESACVLLPPGLSAAKGALAEPLAAALHAVNAGRIAPGDRVAVFGAGPIGLASILGARRGQVGRMVTVAGSVRRESLARRFGSDAFVVAGPDAASAIAEALGGPPAVIIECSGAPGAISAAIGCVAPRGVIVAAGHCLEPDVVMHLDAHMKEVQLHYVAGYTTAEFTLAARALISDDGFPAAVVTDVIGLTELPAAFESLRGRTDQVKVHVDPWRNPC